MSGAAPSAAQLIDQLAGSLGLVEFEYRPDAGAVDPEQPPRAGQILTAEGWRPLRRPIPTGGRR